MKITFDDKIDARFLRYSVIVSKHDGKWVFCKHKNRETLECPGGTRENNETIEECAVRELQEETGATKFTIMPICIYGVSTIHENTPNEEISYGYLYYADIEKFTKINSEIESIHLLEVLPNHWTYPQIQPFLVERVQVHLLLEAFYQAISFIQIKDFDKQQFACLFTDDAMIVRDEKTCTINEYIEEFTTIMQQYPALFKYGFLETQTHYAFHKKDTIIIVDSHYKKAYNKVNDTGINHMQIVALHNHYYISAITYSES